MANLIEAKRLSLGYDELVLKKVGFAFKNDDFIFITGKSGSGKSTFLKSFYGGLGLPPGQFEVCGASMRKIGNLGLLKLRQRIETIFQDYKLVQEYNAEKDVMLPSMIKGYSKKICREQAAKLLKHMNLASKADEEPDRLSGGEQQRVAMTRALAHNPKLLLCDEPTGDLDEYSSDIIWTLLESARELLGTCVVVVTHRIPSNLGLSYRRFNMEDGKMNEVF